MVKSESISRVRPTGKAAQRVMVFQYEKKSEGRNREPLQKRAKRMVQNEISMGTSLPG